MGPDPPSSLEEFWSLPKNSLRNPSLSTQLRLGRFKAEAKRCVSLKSGWSDGKVGFSRGW